MPKCSHFLDTSCVLCVSYECKKALFHTNFPTNRNIKKKQPMTDDEVIEFIQRVGTDMNECSEKIFDGAVHGFITVVDFLF